MSNMTAVPFQDNPIILDISSSYGGILIGMFLSSILYGISCLQVFIYSTNCERDSVQLKYLVFVLWIADTANLLLLYTGSWPVLIKQYGRIAGLSEVQAPIIHHLWVSHIVIASVQLYLARRIYMFGKTGSPEMKLLATCWSSLIAFLVLCELGGVITYEIEGYGKSLAVLSAHLEISVGTALRALPVAVDGLIAVGMTYLLRQTTPEFRRSQRLVSRLLVIVVGSGTLTVLVAIVLLIMITRLPNTLWYCILEFPVCPLYFNTLMVNLNLRKYVRAGGGTGVNSLSNFDSGSGQNTTLVLRNINSKTSNGLGDAHRRTDVKVDQTMTTDQGSNYGQV